MSYSDLTVFALHDGRGFGERVAHALGVPLSEMAETEFEDGEHQARPLESVRGKDVYVVQSLHGGVDRSGDDQLCRLFFFLATLRDAGAGRVTAVLPYLRYARHARRTEPRGPLTLRYVAALFEATRIDRLVAIDVHDVAAFQNAFRIPTEHLEARPLLVEHFARVAATEDVAVVSPDVGGTRRSEAFRRSLAAVLGRDVPTAFLVKRREKGAVHTGALVGEVAGRTAILLDDLVSTGSTLARAAQVCLANGARRVMAAATHGVFVGNAAESIASGALETLVITDTIPPFRLPA
mgnify:CR=1 FL=1